MLPTDVAREWGRIELWLGARAPKLARTLRPPASEDAVEELEQSVGPLPGELRAWLELHDGQDLGEFEVLGRWGLLGTEGIRSAHAMFTRLSARFPNNSAVARGPTEAVFWSRAWIPFAKDGAGDALCVDPRPPVGGTPGQIIEYRHDDDLRVVVAPSLASWFAAVANDLEAGQFELDDIVGSLRRKEE